MVNCMKVAVVTGGHRFDVPNFHGLFRNLEGVDAYIQPLEDFASAQEQARDFYDVAVFYNMHKEGPADENRPGWMGRPRTALESWLETGKGGRVVAPRDFGLSGLGSMGADGRCGCAVI